MIGSIFILIMRFINKLLTSLLALFAKLLARLKIREVYEESNLAKIVISKTKQVRKDKAFKKILIILILVLKIITKMFLIKNKTLKLQCFQGIWWR